MWFAMTFLELTLSLIVLLAVVVFAFILCWLPFHVGRYLFSKSFEPGSLEIAQIDPIINFRFQFLNLSVMEFLLYKFSVFCFIYLSILNIITVKLGLATPISGGSLDRLLLYFVSAGFTLYIPVAVCPWLFLIMYSWKYFQWFEVGLWSLKVPV